ncbi:hypothetical protein L596_029021 [Steinernema carpocapsae]|uniref:Protein kinase domain-containing protein n=1 Tax=Steinernema carpocapsae TaxID=34508 RepID=A0A4U5LTE2_STECR|nr:hypothetical protein L596_029021 [Steinernema carpocapsae]
MCFGVTDASKHRLVLVDFGLVRRYKTAEEKSREKRSRAGFRGTLSLIRGFHPASLWSCEFTGRSLEPSW